MNHGAGDIASLGTLKMRPWARPPPSCGLALIPFGLRHPAHFASHPFPLKWALHEKRLVLVLVRLQADAKAMQRAVRRWRLAWYYGLTMCA